MNATALQIELDKPGGPTLRDHCYISRIKRPEPTAKRKSRGGHRRNLKTQTRIS